MGMWGQHYSPERDGYGKPGDYSTEGMGMEGQTIILLRGRADHYSSEGDG